MTVHRTVSLVENQMRHSDPNARVNICQDDLTLNGNADPLAGGLALLQKKFSLLGLELNKDKSTIWTNPNGLSHNSNIVERTEMKRADAPSIFHLNSNLDDATNNTATTATLPLDSERPFHNETEKTELNILLDKRTDFIKKRMTLTENGLPIHIAQALLRDAAGSDANWHMRSMRIPRYVASEMDRAVGQAYQAILGVGDLTMAQAKRLFIPMREGGFGLASAELQAEPAMMASWASCAASATRDLRDHIGANSRHRVALDSASGPCASGFLQLPVSNTPITPLSSMRPECGCADPCVTPVIGAKTRSVTEPNAEPPLTRKANTRRRARADTPSPRDTTRCETRLRTLRDEPAIVQTSKSLWTTLPLNGARMDVRISKPGVQNAEELIDVQVTSPFCVEAAGLVGKAATIAESKKRTKYRPAVVTSAILETHGRMGRTLKAFLAKIAPEDQQARTTWLQEAMRRILCVLQIHNARIIAKCNGSI